jgi:hypothetical protein
MSETKALSKKVKLIAASVLSTIAITTSVMAQSSLPNPNLDYSMLKPVESSMAVAVHACKLEVAKVNSQFDAYVENDTPPESILIWDQIEMCLPSIIA